MKTIIRMLVRPRRAFKPDNIIMLCYHLSVRLRCWVNLQKQNTNYDKKSSHQKPFTTFMY